MREKHFYSFPSVTPEEAKVLTSKATVLHTGI